MSRRLVKCAVFVVAFSCSAAFSCTTYARSFQGGDQDPSAPRDTLYLSLEDAIDLALENNEDIQIALSNLEKARGRKKEAYASALPYLGVQASYTRNILRPVIFFPNPETDEVMKIEIGEENDFLLNVHLQQALYAFGRIGGAIEAADYYLRSAEAGSKAAERQAVLEVEEAYYQAVLAEEVLEINKLALQQARKHFEETQRKLRQEIAARFDSIRAEVEVKNREPGVINAENAIRLAHLNLKRLVGIDRNVPLVLTDELRFESETYSLDDAIAEAYRIRPDVSALRLQVSMAEKVLQIQKRSNFPFLSLVGSYTLQGQESDKFFPPRNMFAKSLGVGLSLTFPLFDGFANRGRVTQARADYNTTRYSLQKVEKAVAMQIQQLFDVLRAEEENLKSQAATVSMAEEAYRLALVRYKNGLSTSLELEDTELALTSSRLNYLEAVFRYVITKKRFKNAIGH